MSYAEHFRKKVLAKLEEGYSIRAVAAQFEIDKNTIVQWKKCIAIQRTRQHKPCKIDNDALRADVEKYPDDDQYERATHYNWQLKNQTNAIGAIYQQELFAVKLFDCKINSDVFYFLV